MKHVLFQLTQTIFTLILGHILHMGHMKAQSWYQSQSFKNNASYFSILLIYHAPYVF